MRPRKCDEPSRSKSFAGGISTFASKHRALFGFSSRFMQYWKDAEMQLPALHYGEEPDSFLHSIWSYVEDALKRLHSKDYRDPNNEAFVGVDNYLTHGDRLKQQLDIITFIIDALVTHLSVWSVQLRLCLRFLEFYQQNKRCAPSQENEGTQITSQRNEESWHCRGGDEDTLQASIHYLFVEIFTNLSRVLFVAEQEALISVKSSASKHQSTQFKSTNNANGATFDRLIEKWSASARCSILQDFDNCLVQGLRIHSNSIEDIFRKIVAAIDNLATLKTVTDIQLHHQQFNILAEHALSGTDSNYSTSLQEYLSGNWFNGISVRPLQPRMQSEQQDIGFNAVDDWSKHLLDLFHNFGTREEVMMSMQSLMDYLYRDNGYLAKAVDNGTSNVVETSFNNEYFFWLLVSVLQLPGNNDIETSQSSKEKKLVQSTFKRPSEWSAANTISFSSLTFDQKHGWAMLLNLLVYLVEIGSSDAALKKLRSYSVEHFLKPSPLLDFLRRMSLLPTDTQDLLQIPSRISFLSLDITLGRYFSFTYNGHGNFYVPNANDFTSQLFDFMVVHADKLDASTTENIKKLAAKYSKWILPEKVVWAYQKLLEDVIKTNAYILESAETGSEDKRFLQRKIIYATDMIVEVFTTENCSCASIWQAVFTTVICLGLSMGIFSHPGLVDLSSTQGAIESGNPIATIPIVLAHIGTYYNESSTSRSEIKISNSWKELIKDIMIPHSQSWTFLKEKVLYKHSEVWNEPSCHTELIDSSGMKTKDWQREHLQEIDKMVFTSNKEIEQSWHSAAKKEASFLIEKKLRSPEIRESKRMSRGRPSGTHRDIQHKAKKMRLERVQQETQEKVFCENIESSAEEDGYESDEVILLNSV